MSITIDGDTGKVIEESDALVPYKPPKPKISELPPEFIAVLKFFAAVILKAGR